MKTWELLGCTYTVLLYFIWDYIVARPPLFLGAMAIPFFTLIFWAFYYRD